jgi:hypothetical protein
MTGLRTEGFDALVADAAGMARKQSTVADVLRVACGLDGRIPEEVGLSALSPSERTLLEDMIRSGSVLDGDAGGWSLWLTGTGRLTVTHGRPGPDGTGHFLGSVRWPESLPDAPPEAEKRWLEARAGERAGYRQLAEELAREPEEAVRDRLDVIGYSLMHMAPVRLYVGDRTYSNLGSGSNLPGKSVALDAPESLLTGLHKLPVAEWAVEDAVFVACAAALIRSGAPVRLEEFNGIQLTPAALERWLRDRIRFYGATDDEPAGHGVLSRLDLLARRCAALRTGLVADGVQFYRSIVGVNLHKEEQRLASRIGPTDLPPRVIAVLHDTIGYEPGGDLSVVAEAWEVLAPKLTGPSGVGGFSTAFEELLHRLLEAVAEDTDSDVAMARGPRNLAILAAEAASPAAQAKLNTSENYCCVVPRQAFRTRFADDRPSLVKALSAYSARMRYNTWHYLPHSMNLVDREPGRDDWFFAPTMPDITTWSDQHHTGHVMFGVRYAIRVPIGVHFDGAYRPGLYDLRLMRVAEPAFTLDHLRTGIAVGQVLGALHQAMSTIGHHRVTDFDNPWFRTFHG